MPTPKQTQSRITGGSAKGTVFELGVSPLLRPTKNRVLEAGLNMLGSRINFKDMIALDACSGSGQWGMEFLSRGAAVVDFVDADIRLTRKNMKEITGKTDGYGRMFNKNLYSFKPKQPYDVMVADPPYTEEDLYKFILKRNDWLTEKGLLLLEVPIGLELEISKIWTILSDKNYGQSRLLLLQN